MSTPATALDLEQDLADKPPKPPPHTQPLAQAAIGSAVTAVILFLLYGLGVVGGWEWELRVVPGWLTAAALVVAGAAWVALLHERVADRRRVVIRRCIGRDVSALADRLGAVEALLGQSLAALERRVDAVERTVAEQDEEYEKGWVDGAAKTADALTSNGQVRTLHPVPPEPRRPAR